MTIRYTLPLLGLALAAALVAPRALAVPAADGDLSHLSTDDAMLAKALTWVTCTPARIATFENRVHVLCTAPISGIWYFAAPASDPAYAARVLGIFTAAMALGQDLTVLYDPADTSGTAFGCNAADCRRIVGVDTLP
jgi:hypothetical protein